LQQLDAAASWLAGSLVRFAFDGCLEI
jgi:hypothetical protein